MKASFHRRTDLALKALRTLAASGRSMPGADLAEAVGTTIGFLPQVMGPLVRGGWVVSERGPGGGYRLTGTAAEASLLDVIEATEGPTEDGICVMRDGPCPGTPSCPIHPMWLAARQVMVEGFSEVAALS